MKSTLKACTQVVRCLVENVLRCEENAVGKVFILRLDSTIRISLCLASDA